jgi:hypothetical protein
MAPEQARGDIYGLDARTDVFALGAILCEILTGKPPYPGPTTLDILAQAQDGDLTDATARLAGCGTDAELVALCRACLAAKPADRPADAGAVAQAVAAYRAGVERRLREAEVEWAAAQARAEEEARTRQVTQEKLQAERKQLAAERRTRRLAVGLAAVLLAGAGVATALGLVAEWRRERAETAEADAAAKRELAEQRRQQAETNLAYATKANAILASVFAGLDPRAKYQTVSDLRNALKANLAKAVEELDGSAIGDPLVVAQMQNTLGLSLLALRQEEQALTLFQKSRATRSALLGADHPDTLQSMNNLAAGHCLAGKPDLALPLFEETLKLRTARLGTDHPDTLTSMNNLAVGYQAAGKPDLALPLHEEALQGRKAKLGADHPDTLQSMSNLAACFWSLRQLDQSVPLFEQLLPLRVKKLGRDHPDTQRTVANLGVNYKDAGRLTEALPLLEEAYRASARYPTLRWIANSLLDGYVMAGKQTEGARLVTELLASARRTLPQDSPQWAGALAQYGFTLLDLGAFAEAEPLLRECMALRERTQPDAWTTSNTRSLLGGALLGQRKYADAESLLLQGYEGLKAREQAIPPQGAANLPNAVGRLVDLYEATGKAEEAAKWRARLPDKGLTRTLAWPLLWGWPRF